jgi:hypothetical protein
LQRAFLVVVRRRKQSVALAPSPTGNFRKVCSTAACLPQQPCLPAVSTIAALTVIRFAPIFGNDPEPARRASRRRAGCYRGRRSVTLTPP